jgi:hypothetical protein
MSLGPGATPDGRSLPIFMQMVRDIATWMQDTGIDPFTGQEV